MATVVQPVIEPNADAIKAHLLALFAPAREDYPRGLIEIAHGPDQPNQAAYFGFNDDAIDRAVDFAIFCNRRGENVYVGANPRKPTTSLKGRASDSDVEVAFFNFADIDDADAAERVRAGLPLKPGIVVLTGTMPHSRPHLYWQLEEPVGNLAAWRTTQQGIAQSLGGDLVVINPSRIMRLAGTVNYPKQHKLEKGYRMEITSIRTEFTTERPPVTPELIAQAYPARMTEIVTPIHSGQNTLSAMVPNGKTRQLISNALSDNDWHKNVVALTGRLARLGRTTEEIMLMAGGLTRPGYSVADTQREMWGAIHSARTKFNIPEPDEEEEPTSHVTEEGLLPFEWFDDIEPQLTANWLVDDMIPQQGLTLVYGHPGCGKSFFALDIAMHVAMATSWRERDVTQGLVIYIGAEGQRGLRQRIHAFKKTHKIDELPFVLIPVEVDLLTSKSDVAAAVSTIRHCAERFGLPIAMIVIDTLSRTFGGGDEAGPDMAAYVNNVGSIQTMFKCAAMVIHHRPKDSTNETPRGHGSLWGACDAIFLVEDMGGPKQVKNTKQKDGELADPVLFKLKVVELGEDEKGKPVTSCVVEIADSAVMASNASPKKLTAGQRITLEQLGQVMETEGVSPPNSIPENALNRLRVGKVVSVEKWQSRTVQSLSGPDMTPDSAVRTFRRNRQRLQELNIIGVFGDFAWIVH